MKLNIKVKLEKSRAIIKDISEILEPYNITKRDEEALSNKLSELITNKEYIVLENMSK